jgi:hypothetical protein
MAAQPGIARGYAITQARGRAMTAGPGLDSSNAVELVSAGAQQSFNSTAMSRLEGRPVVRFPEQLRLHRALHELGWTGDPDEFNDAVRFGLESIHEPILITPNGTILAGFGRWRLALLQGTREIHCIEYPLSEDKSLPFILNYHQARRGWNAFVRIRLALTQKPLLQQRALDNMRAGGKIKGWANLPDPQRIEVRQGIARAAGVCPRNVSKVEKILEVAHPRLIEALQDGRLKIDRATHFCKSPRAEQLEQFIHWSEECATKKVIRQCIAEPKGTKTTPDAATVLDVLRQQETAQPGSIVLLVSRLPQTVIFIGRDLQAGSILTRS